MGESRTGMQVIEQIDVLTKYEELCKRIKALNPSENFRILIPTSDNVSEDNKIRDVVLHLMAYADKQNVKTRMYVSQINVEYVLEFAK